MLPETLGIASRSTFWYRTPTVPLIEGELLSQVGESLNRGCGPCCGWLTGFRNGAQAYAHRATRHEKVRHDRSLCSYLGRPLGHLRTHRVRKSGAAGASNAEARRRFDDGRLDSAISGKACGVDEARCACFRTRRISPGIDAGVSGMAAPARTGNRLSRTRWRLRGEPRTTQRGFDRSGAAIGG